LEGVAFTIAPVYDIVPLVYVLRIVQEYHFVEEALCCSNEGSMALHCNLNPESGQDSQRNGEDDLSTTVGIDVFSTLGSECEVGRLIRGW